MLYLDTSVLLAYTLTKTMEPSRFRATSGLFQLVNQGVVKAVTSFYALHELLVMPFHHMTSRHQQRGAGLGGRKRTGS